jgi:hypothetical protein
VIDEPEGEIFEVPARKWNWIILPIVACGFVQATATAAGEVCENLITAMGMHLSYKRNEEDRNLIGGPVFRED